MKTKVFIQCSFYTSDKRKKKSPGPVKTSTKTAPPMGTVGYALKITSSVPSAGAWPLAAGAAGRTMDLVGTSWRRSWWMLVTKIWSKNLGGFFFAKQLESFNCYCFAEHTLQLDGVEYLLWHRKKPCSTSSRGIPSFSFINFHFHNFPWKQNKSIQIISPTSIFWPQVFSQFWRVLDMHGWHGGAVGGPGQIGIGVHMHRRHRWHFRPLGLRCSLGSLGSLGSLWGWWSHRRSHSDGHLRSESTSSYRTDFKKTAKKIENKIHQKHSKTLISDVLFMENSISNSSPGKTYISWQKDGQNLREFQKPHLFGRWNCHLNEFWGENESCQVSRQVQGIL